jgi:hypothetical protein
MINYTSVGLTINVKEVRKVKPFLKRRDDSFKLVAKFTMPSEQFFDENEHIFRG